MSAFSLVELKGNYISDLILLRRKVSDSDSLERAYVRIRRTGGRKSGLMLAQLICLLGGLSFPINPWVEARRVLITHLDAQIAASWEEFRSSVDQVFDDFRCSRAAEEPQDHGDRWSTTIPQCRQDNTRCYIIAFMRSFNKELNKLVDLLTNLDTALMTRELEQIKRVAEDTLNNNRFPWEKNTCRQIGDLLVGLQSKVGCKLISSNNKEHSQMHLPLEYVFHKFPIVEIRSK